MEGKCLALAVQSTTRMSATDRTTCELVRVAPSSVVMVVSNPATTTTANGTVPQGTSHSRALSGGARGTSGLGGMSDPNPNPPPRLESESGWWWWWWSRYAWRGLSSPSFSSALEPPPEEDVPEE